MSTKAPKRVEKTRRKRCKYCRRLFSPDPRVKEKQKACFRDECKKKRKQEAQRKWLEKNRGYYEGRYLELKEWFEQNPKKERDIKAALKAYRSIFVMMCSQMDIFGEIIISNNNNFQDKKLKKYQRNQEVMEKMISLLKDKRI
jgi:hypothetical protein